MHSKNKQNTFQVPFICHIVFKAPTIFATRQDIRLPSVAAHRKVNHDLRKALNHVMSDSVKNAAKGQGMNMVTFEEDEKEVEGKVEDLNEKV